MIPYLILIISIPIVGTILKLANVSSKTVIIWLFLAITTMACLRDYSVGTDTRYYVRRFISIQSINWTDLYKESKVLNIEYGYAVLNKIVGIFTKSPRIFIAVCAIFIEFSFARFIYKYSSDVVISTYMFLTWEIFFHSLNIMRQYLALAILLFALDAFIEDKKIIYFILLGTAYFFHKSSLCFILIIFIKNIKINYKFLLEIIFVAVIIINYVEDILIKLSNYGYRDYMARISSEGGDRGGMVIASSLVILVFCFLIMIDKIEDKNSSFFLAIFSLGILIQLMSLQFKLVARIAYYFTWTIIIFVPNLINKVSKTNKRIVKILGYVGFYTLLFIFFVFSLYLVMEQLTELYHIF